MNKIYENALKDSTKKTVISYKKHKKQLKATAISICLSTMLASSILVPKISNGIEDLSNNYKSDKLSSTIISMIDETSEKGNIISKNTYRTNDGQGYFYDTYKIAEDILKVEPSFFDITVFNTYNNMKYKENMDDVIKSIKNIVNDNKEEYPELFFKLKDVNSFESYLKRLHCVNKDGSVSIEKYNQYGTSLENIYGDILRQEAEKKESQKK